jgi:hypothetical protein
MVAKYPMLVVFLGSITVWIASLWLLAWAIY